MLQRLLASPIPGTIVTVVGNAVSDEISAAVVVGVGALWIVAAGQWRDRQQRQELAPKLGLVMGRGAPFERDKETVTPIHKVTPRLNLRAGGMRIHGVGIVNSGQQSAMGVRVKVTRIEPPELRQYWTAALHVANEAVSVDRCDVHHATKPHLFFEVVSQHFDVSTKKANSLRVRFAGSLFEREIPLREQYFFWLAIDGPKAGPEQRFVLQLNEAGQYEMREALYAPHVVSVS